MLFFSELLHPFQGYGEGAHVGKGRVHPHFLTGPYVSIYKVRTRGRYPGNTKGHQKSGPRGTGRTGRTRGMMSLVGTVGSSETAQNSLEL